jgi:hypothetical protein
MNAHDLKAVGFVSLLHAIQREENAPARKTVHGPKSHKNNPASKLLKPHNLVAQRLRGCKLRSHRKIPMVLIQISDSNIQHDFPPVIS